MGAIQLDVGKKKVEVWIETVAPEGRSRMGYGGGGDETPDRKVAPALIATAVRSLAEGLALEVGGDGSPDEIGLDFGVSLDPDGHVVIGQAGTFKVSLRWKRSG